MKRTSPATFDPVQVLDELHQQRAVDAKRRQCESEVQLGREKNIQKALKSLSENLEVSSLRNLAQVLRENGYAFWSEFKRCSIPRELLVMQLRGEILRKLLADNASQLLAWKLLLAAFERRAVLESELLRIARLRGAKEIRSWLIPYFGECLSNLKYCLEERQEIPTPWLMRSELSQAVQADRAGFSKKGIRGQLVQGTLVIEDQQPLNRQATLCRFRHLDPQTHERMLESVVKLLTKSDNLVSRQPLLRPLWEPVNVVIGSKEAPQGPD